MAGALFSSSDCYFVISEKAYESLAESTVPEVQRCNMAPVVLQLKALGVDNVLRFHYLSVSGGGEGRGGRGEEWDDVRVCVISEWVGEREREREREREVCMCGMQSFSSLYLRVV